MLTLGNHPSDRSTGLANDISEKYEYYPGTKFWQASIVLHTDYAVRICAAEIMTKKAL